MYSSVRGLKGRYILEVYFPFHALRGVSPTILGFLHFAGALLEIQ